MNNKGFTMLELSVVLLIVLIFGNIFLFSFSSIEKKNFDAATIQLVNDLRLAQRVAISENLTTRIFFNTTNNCYYFDKQAPNDSFRQIKEVLLPKNIRLLEVTCVGNKVQYTNRGTTGSAGTIVLTSNKINRLSKITVNVGSGRVKINYYKIGGI